MPTPQELRAQERRAQMMSMYDQLPGGQTGKNVDYMGLSPESGYPTGLNKATIKV